MDKQIDVAQNADALVQALVLLVSEIKEKQSLGQIVASEIAALPALINAVSNLSGDVKSDLPGVMNAVALGLSSLVQLFV